MDKFEAGLFDCKDEMKEKILSILETKGLTKDSDNLQLGYIIPGHGLKGKQHSIDSDLDIDSMYDVYGVRSPIIMWVKVTPQARKRLAEVPQANSNTPSKKMKSEEASKLPQTSSYKSHVNKMAEVDCIVEELEKKHTGEKFSPEQLRAWAHMIQLKKHTSYEVPPDKPFFRTRNSKPSEPQGISPAKRITLRSECIDQLEKWHTLMERGAISPDQYRELQSTIMSDIKKF